jgi:hypothetical protein
METDEKPQSGLTRHSPSTSSRVASWTRPPGSAGPRRRGLASGPGARSFSRRDAEKSFTSGWPGQGGQDVLVRAPIDKGRRAGKSPGEPRPPAEVSRRIGPVPGLGNGLARRNGGGLPKRPWTGRVPKQPSAKRHDARAISGRHAATCCCGTAAESRLHAHIRFHFSRTPGILPADKIIEKSCLSVFTNHRNVLSDSSFHSIHDNI